MGMTKEAFVLRGRPGRWLSRGRVDVADQRELVEAVAVWTENLRDSITASIGLEQALVGTAGHCPSIIAEPIQRLVASMRYRGLEDALREFAHALGNPTSDFVVAALITALRNHTRDLSGLLTHLSDAARAETDLYARIWVSRARSRTSARIISSSVVLFVLGLVLLNPLYLAPFLESPGVFVLGVVICCFVFGLRWLSLMSSLEAPPRFLGQVTDAS